MSIKTERIGSNFVKEISYILMEEIKDPNIKFVTITSCDVTNDLSYAKVYFTVLDDTKKEPEIPEPKNQNPNSTGAPNQLPGSDNSNNPLDKNKDEEIDYWKNAFEKVSDALDIKLNRKPMKYVSDYINLADSIKATKKLNKEAEDAVEEFHNLF